MVVATARAHEHGLAAELAGDDLEAEDPAVELGRPGRVADEQDGVVEAGDGDAHRDSVRHRSGAGHAATGRPAGAPTSFQPDCQSAVGDVEGDVQEGQALELAGPGQRSDVDRFETDRAHELEHDRLGRGIVIGDVAVELDAVGDRVALVRGEQRVERLDDVRVGQQRRELLGVRGRRIDGRARRRRTTSGSWRRRRSHREPRRGSRRRSPTTLANGMARTMIEAARNGLGVRAGHAGARRDGDAAGILRVARGDDDRMTGADECGGEGSGRRCRPR